jgi:phosphoribosylformylglycinamidine cyclo-ligase
MKASVEASHGPRVLGGLGSFGGMYDASFLKDMAAPILVASTDGVGTKTRVATALGRYDNLGRDLVQHCINDILVTGAPSRCSSWTTSLRRSCPRLGRRRSPAPSTAAARWAARCSAARRRRLPGCTPTVRYDLAAFIVGVVDRAKLLTGERLAPGDLALALRATGCTAMATAWPARPCSTRRTRACTCATRCPAIRPGRASARRC